MAWRKLELRDVAATLSQEEMDAYRQYNDFHTGRDPIEDLCSQVAAFCRMKIRKNFFVKLSPDVAELPPELISPACDIVAFKVLKRLPVEMTEPRKIAYNNALDLLKEIQNDETRPESYLAEGEEAQDEEYRNDPFIVVNVRPTILR